MAKAMYLSEVETPVPRRTPNRPKSINTPQTLLSTYVHIFLFMFNSSQLCRQLPDHVLELRVSGLLLCRCARCSLWCIANIYREHHHFRHHGRHLVAEANCVQTRRVSGKRVFAGGLPFARVDNVRRGAGDLDVDIKEAAFDNFKRDTCNEYSRVKLTPYKPVASKTNAYSFCCQLPPVRKNILPHERR